MLTSILLIGLFIDISVSLQCYACQSCSDPFYLDQAPMLYLPDNEGFNCTKEHTMFGIDRGAMKNCGINNTERWCCETDLCNGNYRLTWTNISFLFIFLLFVFSQLVHIYK